MLPMLLLAAAARSRLAAGVSERTMLPGMAMTGELEGTRVLPVREEGLRLKVRACFFAPVRILWVPAEQRAIAREEVRRLSEAWPHRQMMIEGVRDARELWDHPLVMQHRLRRPREVAGAAMRRMLVSRVFLVVVSLIALLAGGLAAWQVWLYRDEPVAAVWETGNILVTNPSGRTCLRIEAPPGPAQPGSPWPGGHGGDFLLVCDLDGSGKNGIAALLWNGSRLLDRLAAWDRRGRPLWTLSSSARPPSLVPQLDDVRWVGFALAGRTPQGHVRFLAVRKSTQRSLCLIDLLDGGTGEQLGMLRSNGHVEAIDRVDLDHDGIEEICLPGQDNPSGHAVITLVDPESMRVDGEDGPVPVVDPRSLERGVVWSIRFVPDRFLHGSRPSCTEIRPESDGQVRVSVNSVEAYAISYYLRFSRAANPRVVSVPQVVSVQIADAYRARLLSFLSSQVTMEDFRKEEERLLSTVEILTRDGWRPVPVAGSEGTAAAASGEGARPGPGTLTPSGTATGPASGKASEKAVIGN